MTCLKKKLVEIIIYHLKLYNGGIQSVYDNEIKNGTIKEPQFKDVGKLIDLYIKLVPQPFS